MTTSEHAESTTSSAQDAAAEKHESLIIRLLDNPFTGFAPWIVLSVLMAPGRFEFAAGAALAMSIGFVVSDHIRGRTIKMLAVVDVVSFAVFLVAGALASTAQHNWLETWFGEVSNILLAVIVVGSMLFRVPFTIQYAKEQTDPEHWKTPMFLRINYVITAAWAGAFVVSAVAGFYGDAVLKDNDNLWTGWIIQIGASLVAIQFTTWYPEYAKATALQAVGQPTDPPPPVGVLMAPLIGYLLPIGIVSLVADAAPTWVGIALIVASVVLGAQVRRFVAASPAALAV